MKHNEIRKYIQQFKKNIHQMLEIKRELDLIMSQEPLEVQLEYYFDAYGWKVIKTLPPDEDETVMYVYAEKGDENREYCVPDLPCNLTHIAADPLIPENFSLEINQFRVCEKIFQGSAKC